jgi:2EXR family
MQSLITTFILELPDSNQDLYPQIYLDEFHPFSNLPPELRLKIWKCILPPPRHWYMGSKQSVFPPITSRINKESRLVTMRYYLLVTFFKPVPEGTVERENQIIYRRQRARRDFNKDIVCIHECYFFQRRNPR